MEWGEDIRGQRMGGWTHRGWTGLRFWGAPVFSPEASTSTFKRFWTDLGQTFEATRTQIVNTTPYPQQKENES